MAQQNTEDRLAALERDVAALKQFRQAQEDRDVALLARIDGFIDDLRRIERVQMRAFEELKSDQQELKAGQKNIETALASIAEIFKDHKTAIETLGGRMNNVEEGQRALQAGQEQIIAILTGKSKTND